YQDVRANQPRRSLGQAGTSGPFKSLHVVNAGGRALSCPDVDDGSILVHQIELRANANAADYPIERPLDCGRPDLRRHLMHVDADECFPVLPIACGTSSSQKLAAVRCCFHARRNSPTTPSVLMSCHSPKLRPRPCHYAATRS